ncbi:MAG: penicillin acylase family protein, partial [Candidatus Kapabacteria bacterium]|nr:penicillin acylase family protein [Candidatus Kapabacteria bacterium]MDW7996764.1 penicillin acylase family protein [Bacteroidota bacterium]
MRWRYVFTIPVTVLVALLSLITGGWLFLQRSLPPEFAEVPSHVRDSVTVWRDSFAIPTIVAAHTMDAFFAMGYLHAQDRLWQMDIARRVALGRVAEILGAEAFPLDYLMRTLGLERIANSTWDSLHPVSRAILRSYAEGVNTWLQQNSSRLPPECILISYTPEPWEPIHSLAIARLMSFDLAFSFWSDIAMGTLAEELGMERAWELLPNYPPNAPTIVDEAPLAPPPPAGDTLLPKLGALQRPPQPPGGFTRIAEALGSLRSWLRASPSQGSNAWAVRTHTGAILANDPHLVLGLPPRWYPVCVLSPDYEVAGLTFPGLPLVIIGRNRFIAWGVTNLMADESDFFIERVDTAYPFQYWNGHQWQRFQRWRDTLRIRGKPSVVVEIWRSQNGPIISDAHLFAAPRFLFQRPEDTTTNSFLRRYRISYRWASAERISDEVWAAYQIGRARSWNQFQAALRRWGSPVLCFVYADRQGNVAAQPAGYIPLRDTSLPEASWAFPLPGWEKRYRWHGLVNAVELPNLVNPRQGFVVSANNKLTHNPPFPLTYIWEPASRAQRLTELLLQRSATYGLTDAERMQMDVLSPYAREMMLV